MNKLEYYNVLCLFSKSFYLSVRNGSTGNPCMFLQVANLEIPETITSGYWGFYARS